MLFTPLRTARLELGLPSLDEAEAITAAAQDPEVPRWTTLPSPYELHHAEDFIRSCEKWTAEGSQLNWAIRHDGRWVGMIGLAHLERPGFGEIGYWMAADARGNGYLTEAARAVVDHAFRPDGLDLDRIEWHAVVGNIPSARTARALGFRYEGTLRQGLLDPRGRHDGWVAGLLRDDDRTPVDWPVL
jgi:RimJ/RimL family protein N-acetyltransferase